MSNMSTLRVLAGVCVWSSFSPSSACNRNRKELFPRIGIGSGYYKAQTRVLKSYYSVYDDVIPLW